MYWFTKKSNLFTDWGRKCRNATISWKLSEQRNSSVFTQQDKGDSDERHSEHYFERGYREGQLPVVLLSLFRLTPFPDNDFEGKQDRAHYRVSFARWTLLFVVFRQRKEFCRQVNHSLHSFISKFTLVSTGERKRKSTTRQDVGLFTHTLCRHWLHHPVSCDPTVGLLSNCLPSSCISSRGS